MEQAEAKTSVAPSRVAQFVRITICVLSMGFIFPHAIAEGLDGEDPAAPAAKAAQLSKK